MIFTLIFFLLNAFSLSQAQVISCNTFAPGLGPCVKDTNPAYPSVIDGVQVSIYHFASGWTSTRKQTTGLESIEAGSQFAIHFYSQFQNALPPNIVFVLLGGPGNVAANVIAQTTFPKQSNGPCVVKFYPGFLATTVSFQTHTVAHEIYHCIALWMIGFTDLPNASKGQPPYTWWFEGSAEHMANEVYPGNTFSRQADDQYIDSEPLYHNPNPKYSPNMFFLTMRMHGKTPSDINDWVRMQKYTNTFADERGRLTHLGGFGDAYQYFAEQFELGQLIDTGGHFFTTKPSIPNLIDTSNLKAEKPIRKRIRVTPFAMSVSEIALDPGQTVQLSYDTNNNGVVIEYRAEGKNTWTRMAPRSASTVTFVLGCRDPQLTLYVLMTSTDDIDGSATAFLTITNVLDKTCACTTPTKTIAARDGNNRRQATQPASCPSLSPPTNSSCNSKNLPPDPCLAGNWTLDLENMKSIVMALASQKGYAISDLSITGSGGLTIPTNPSTGVLFTYNNFIASYTITVSGISVSTSTEIDGYFTASLYMQSASSFCLNVLSGNGTVSITTSLDTGPPFVLSITDGFVPRGMVVQETCTQGGLGMVGVNIGTQQWNYQWLRA